MNGYLSGALVFRRKVRTSRAEIEFLCVLSSFQSLSSLYQRTLWAPFKPLHGAHSLAALEMVAKCSIIHSEHLEFKPFYDRDLSNCTQPAAKLTWCPFSPPSSTVACSSLTGGTPPFSIPKYLSSAAAIHLILAANLFIVSTHSSSG